MASAHPAPAAAQNPVDANPLGSAPVVQLLLKYAPPAILSMMVTALYNIIDTFFVGHGVGEDGIAATTVAFPLMMLMGAFAAWFGVGGNALAALKLGEGRRNEAERTLGNTTFLLIVVPVAITAVAMAFLDPVLEFLGATDANRQHSHDFCSVIMLGFVVQAVGTGLTNFIRTDGAPNYALFVMLIGTVVSAVLNWVFVMLLGMGMTGSALATVAGQLVTLALVVQYFLSHRCNLRLRPQNMRPYGPLVAKIAVLGLSTFLVQVAGALTSSMLNYQITALGPTDPIGADGGLTVIGTVNKVIQLMFFIIMGFSVAVQPILGYNYGAQNYRRVRSALWITIAAASLVNLVLWILCHLFIDQIMAFFGLESDLFAFATTTFVLMTLIFPVVPFQVIGSNYFQATGQPLKATFLTLTRQLIFYLPCLFIVPQVLPSLLGMTALACLPAAPAAADALAIVTTAVFMAREMKRLDALQVQHDERVANREQSWAQLARSLVETSPQPQPQPPADTPRATYTPPAPCDRDPFVRAANEDDDGYDPYSDRPADREPLFERDPWS